MSGPLLFTRFAYPPNSLGYCGPADHSLLAELAAGPDAVHPADFRGALEAFAGAWPYLELIAGCSGHDPLDQEVVEAYWLGNGLLDNVDILIWGNALDDRFRARAGFDWDALISGLQAGGVPNHAFHVFCAYPWVGLLRSGAVDQALLVLDRCRIRWGTVTAVAGAFADVVSRPLHWDGHRLQLGHLRRERVTTSVDPRAAVAVGDEVAMHWDYICQRITPRQRQRLSYFHDKHLAIANRHPTKLAARIEA